MGYQIVRSRRKTMALEVTREGELLVRVPLRTPEGVIRAFVEEHRGWIARAQLRQAERQARHPEPTADEAAALRKKAKAVLPEKVRRYGALLGVTPTAIHITSARTRFGSCSGKNSISFSWRLMQYPEAAVDYVVVHELSHILHHNHSRAFYACIARILPDYKARAALLKQ